MGSSFSPRAVCKAIASHVSQPSMFKCFFWLVPLPIFNGSRAPASRRSGLPPILQIAAHPVRPVKRSSLLPTKVRWACSY